MTERRRDDQEGGYALTEYLLRGQRPQRTPLLQALLDRHGRLNRLAVAAWGEGMNLIAMALAVGTLLDLPGYRDAWLLFLSDQRHHGQPADYRHGHRGRIEAMSGGYARYAWLAALAGWRWGDHHQDLELVREARLWLRTDLVWYGMHRQEGAVYAATGRCGVPETPELSWVISALLGDPVPGQPPGTGPHWWTYPQSQVARIVRAVGSDLGDSLLTDDQRQALRSWAAEGELGPELQRLLQEVHHQDPQQLWRWPDGSIASFWPRMRSYRGSQGIVPAVVKRRGQRAEWVHLRGDAADVQVTDGHLVVHQLDGSEIGRLPLPSGPPIHQLTLGATGAVDPLPLPPSAITWPESPPAGGRPPTPEPPLQPARWPQGSGAAEPARAAHAFHLAARAAKRGETELALLHAGRGCRALRGWL